MGCRELDITSYYQFVSTQCTPKKSHSHAQTSSCTQKNAYSGFSHTVVSGYRYYDANMGRWLNRDPIGEMVYDEDGESQFNLLYGFVNNYSVNHWDYLGLETYHGFTPKRENILKADYGKMKKILKKLMKEINEAFLDQEFKNATFTIFGHAWGFKQGSAVIPNWKRLSVKHLRGKLRLMTKVIDDDDLKIKCGSKILCAGGLLSIDAYVPQSCDAIYICDRYFTNAKAAKEGYATIGHELSHYATHHEIKDFYLKKPIKYIYDAHVYSWLFLNN